MIAVGVPPPPPVVAIVIESVVLSFVIVMPLPATSVSVSVLESATTSSCPLTEIVSNELDAEPPAGVAHAPFPFRNSVAELLSFGSRPCADAVAFNLSELRRHRSLTQVELAERLQRAQASISAMETADDNLLSTWRSVVESMGGHLELVAVFDDERIAIPS